MKKLLLFFIFTAVNIITLEAQYNESAPWMNDLIKKKSAQSKKTDRPNFTLQEVSNAFNEYWKDKDITEKGIGYKPFKRWEHEMKNYVLKDGTLMEPEQIWKAWEQKQKMQQNRESNWKTAGPFTTNLKYGQGRVNTFIVDPNNPNTFYVGAPAGGIWKSIDGGRNWEVLSDYIPQIGVSAIAINPNNSDIIYIGTGDDDGGDTRGIGVMKSIDGGKTWYKTNSTMTENVNEIYIHPMNSNILWASSWAGFYKSTDAGENWNQIKLPNQTNQIISILDLKIKPDDPDTIYIATRNEFYKSTDGGESFTKINSGLPNISGRLAIAVTPANPNLVYILSAKEDDSFQGLYKSTNSGISFVKTNANISNFRQIYYNMALTVSPADADVIFVGTVVLYKSIDGGNSFSDNKNYEIGSRYTHVDIHFLRYFNNHLYAGTDGGIYESTNNGNSFNDLTEGLSISQFYKISIPTGNLNNILGGLQDNGGFSYKNKQWYYWHAGDATNNAIHPVYNNQEFYFSFLQQGSYLMVSTDGGVSLAVYLQNPNQQGAWETPLQMSNNGVLYAGYKDLFKLNDNFNGWVKLSQTDFGSLLSNIEIAPSNNKIIFVSTLQNKLFKSTDEGITFNPITIPDQIFYLSSIEIDNNNSEIIYITEGALGNVHKSTNGGSSWVSIKRNLPDEPIRIIKHQEKSDKNDIYIGTSLGVYHTNDDMNEWERFDTNLPNVPVRDIEINIDNSTITVATYGRGVWVSPLANSSALAVDEFDDNAFSIYPNPSNGFITIKNKENIIIVEVTIFDVMGKELKTITKNTSNIDISTLSNGIYFLKIKTDKGEISKKMIVSK